MLCAILCNSFNTGLSPSFATRPLRWLRSSPSIFCAAGALLLASALSAASANDESLDHVFLFMPLILRFCASRVLLGTKFELERSELFPWHVPGLRKEDFVAFGVNLQYLLGALDVSLRDLRLGVSCAIKKRLGLPVLLGKREDC